jgi:hypothetical protein
MKKERMRQWMADYLKTQSRLTTGSFAAMAVIGAIATLIEFGFVLLIIHIGFISSWIFGAMVAIGILAAVQFATWLRLPIQLPESIHEVDIDGQSTEISIPPTMPMAWTYAFGSLDSNQSRIELLLGILAMPQRMCSAAWFVWNRLQELKTVDVEAASDVIWMLHERGERVDVSVLAAELSLSSVPKTIRDVTLIDGVVLLSRGNLGLSLANRLVDDLATWRKKNSRQ